MKYSHKRLPFFERNHKNERKAPRDLASADEENYNESEGSEEATSDQIGGEYV